MLFNHVIVNAVNFLHNKFAKLRCSRKGVFYSTGGFGLAVNSGALDDGYKFEILKSNRAAAAILKNHHV